MIASDILTKIFVRMASLVLLLQLSACASLIDSGETCGEADVHLKTQMSASAGQEIVADNPEPGWHSAAFRKNRADDEEPS